MTGRYVAFIKDDIPVLDENGLFRFKGRIGMILPLLREDKDSFLVYIPVRETQLHRQNRDCLYLLKDLQINRRKSL